MNRIKQIPWHEYNDEPKSTRLSQLTQKQLMCEDVATDSTEFNQMQMRQCIHK